MTPFHDIKNIPFDMQVLASIFPECKHITEKARHLESAGKIVRLKKGMYVASEDETGVPLSRTLIANHLYGPSYVGGVYALRYWGLIPERVNMLTCVTTKHARDFENVTGRYTYENCQTEYFKIGVKIERADGVNFLIAGREKALCDVINYSKSLNLRFMKDVETYLEEDIRFETEELDSFDLDTLEECAKYSRKGNSIRTLIKYIRHVRHIRRDAQ